MIPIVKITDNKYVNLFQVTTITLTEDCREINLVNGGMIPLSEETAARLRQFLDNNAEELPRVTTKEQ